MTVPGAAGRLGVRWTDVALALGVGVAEIVGTLVVVQNDPTVRPVAPLAIALLVANSAPLVVRDRYPRAVLLLVSVAAAAYTLLSYPGGFATIGVVLAIWAAVAAGERLARLGQQRRAGLVEQLDELPQEIEHRHRRSVLSGRGHDPAA
jgi:hypothetical protein